MSYQRPIIIEIYAELFFEPGTFAFAQMLELVPPLQRSGFSTVESPDVAEIAEDPERRSAWTPRIRCWSDDKTRLVQLAPESIAMNLVSPDGTYPGWDRFVSEVVRPTCEIVGQIVPRARPVSLALNTLDRFAVSNGLRLGEFLNCGGPRIPAILADTTEAFDYDIGRGLLQNDGRNRQLHINGRPGAAGYVVNIHAVFHERMRDDEDTLRNLERLHDEANTVFESLITDRTRNEVMKGHVHAIAGL